MTYLPVDLRDLGDVSTTTPSDGQALVYNTTSGVWEPADQAASSPLTTKGDLYTYGTDDARLPVGTNGHVLTADSAQTLGVKWAAPTSSAGGLGAKVTGASPTSIPTASGQIISWSTEAYDDDSMVDLGTSASRITIQTSGRYLIVARAQLEWLGGAMQVGILVNGTLEATVWPQAPTNEWVQANTLAIMDLSASDYVQMRVRQTSGSSQTLTSTAERTSLTVAKI